MKSTWGEFIVAQKNDTERDLLNACKEYLESGFFGETLDGYLKGSGKERKEIAEHLSFDQSTLSQWTNNNRITTYMTVERVSIFIGLPEEDKVFLFKALYYERNKREILDYINEAEELNIDPKDIVKSIEFFLNDLATFIEMGELG